MKMICFILLSLFIASCSELEVNPVGHKDDLSQVDLAVEAKKKFKESKVVPFTPTEEERADFYSSLQDSIAYQRYLFLECVSLLHREKGLNLSRPVYASRPKWNNLKNYFIQVIEFQSTKEDLPIENTMECNLAVNSKQEVSEYQIKKFYRQLRKE